MDLRQTQTEAEHHPDRHDVAHSRLRGGWLVLVQLVCLSVAVLALGLFFAGVPLRFHELLTLSQQAERAVRQLPLGVERSLLQGVLSVNFYPLYALTIEITLVLGFVLANGLILWHRPNDWRVLLFSIVSLTFGTYITRCLNALVQVYPQWRLPVGFLQALGLAATVLYFYTFPDGRFFPSWTRPVAVVWILWTLAWLLFPAVPFNFSNPYTLSFPWFVVYMLWWVTGILAQLSRYRQISKPYRRRQMRWVVFSISSAALSFAVYYAPRVLFPFFGQPNLASVIYNAVGIPLLLSFVLIIPVSYLFSLVRFHMFDIEVIINRTLVYGSLTAILALIYFGLIFTLQFLLRGLINQQNDVAIVISTLAIAALFQPLRHRLQNIIDRRFYRRKYDAAKTIAAFSSQLRQEVDLDTLQQQLLTVVAETMQPAHLSLWMRSPQSAAHRPEAHTSTSQEQ